MSPETTGHEAKPQGYELRRRVDKWLAGCAAVREGVFDRFALEDEEGGFQIITPDNVEIAEKAIRRHFSDLFPDIAVE